MSVTACVKKRALARRPAFFERHCLLTSGAPSKLCTAHACTLRPRGVDMLRAWATRMGSSRQASDPSNEVSAQEPHTSGCNANDPQCAALAPATDRRDDCTCVDAIRQAEIHIYEAANNHMYEADAWLTDSRHPTGAMGKAQWGGRPFVWAKPTRGQLRCQVPDIDDVRQHVRPHS